MTVDEKVSSSREQKAWSIPSFMLVQGMVDTIVYASTFWEGEIENQVSLVLAVLCPGYSPGYTGSLLDHVSYPDGPLSDLNI